MEARKIGAYLIEDKFCDDEMIHAAFERQLALEREGIYKPIGQILIDMGGLNPETLDLILHRQGEDLLRSVEPFKSLPPDLILKIIDVAECQAIPKGDIIIYEGDQGDAFYQIISGSTRVFQISEDGIDVTLTTLGPGEGFGEMSLLTGEPRSASVSALEACGFLVISKAAFDRLSAENPEFSLLLSKTLSSRLAQGSHDIVSATVTEKAYQRFVSEQSADVGLHFVERSKATKKLNSQIDEAAKNDRPILIQGEPGTEKSDVAALIHRGSNRKEAPFLVVNAKTVNLGRIVDQPKKRDPIRLELGQISSLFGHAKDALSFAPERRLGLFQVGDGGTVVIENIENLTEGVQIKLIDFIRHGHFTPLGDQNSWRSSIRVLATSSADLGQRAKEGKFSDELLDLLGKDQTLDVPPLRKRKKDLRQLVEKLIEHYSDEVGKSITGIDHDVYNSIMAYDWPGNNDELRVVIRRAVILTQGTRLAPEDIFIDTAPQIAGKFSFNFLQLDWVRQLFQSRAFPGSAQIITAFFWILIITLGLFGSQTSNYNISLELTWGLWEPLVVLSCILVARIWCAICPVGALSSIISGRYGLRHSIPYFIRNNGIYVGAVGLGLISLSEVVFKMPSSPRATAFLILSITLPAVILALIFRRRVWCRFLCPLGKLVGFLSRCSFIELRANHNICNSDCTEHTCYVGREGQRGCPVFEAPFSLHSNQDCVLCGNCIKNCENQSPVLNLRAPGHELWTFRKPDLTISLLGVFIIGSQIFRGLEKTGYFYTYIAALNHPWLFHSTLIAITTLFAFLFVKTTGMVTFGHVKAPSREKWDLMLYAFVPLVVAFELSFHFERMMNHGGQLLPTLARQLDFSWSFIGMRMDPWLIKSNQIVLVLLGIFASTSVLKRLLCSRLNISLQRLSFQQRWPILLLGAGYIWFFCAG